MNLNVNLSGLGARSLPQAQMASLISSNENGALMEFMIDRKYRFINLGSEGHDSLIFSW